MTQERTRFRGEKRKEKCVSGKRCGISQAAVAKAKRITRQRTSARTRCRAASRASSSAFFASLSIPWTTSSRRAAKTGSASAFPHMLLKQGARVCRSPARGSGGKRIDVHFEGESKMPSGRGCVARTDMRPKEFHSVCGEGCEHVRSFLKAPGLKGRCVQKTACKEVGEGKVVTRFPDGVREKAAEEFEGALAMSEATFSFPSIIGSTTSGESPMVFMNSVLLI
jgi:hypothetical protein